MIARLLSIGTFVLAVVATANSADPKRETLWAAVRSGDVKAIQDAIDKGADVNAKNEYGVSALWIAAGKGKFAVVETLVKNGADVNCRDDIWYQTPLTSATGGNQLKTVSLLIKSGAKDTDAAFLAASGSSN